MPLGCTESHDYFLTYSLNAQDSLSQNSDPVPNQHVASSYPQTPLALLIRRYHLGVTRRHSTGMGGTFLTPLTPCSD